MSQSRVGRAGRDGFTLVEVLVTLILIALLVGVVLPAVIRQVDRGEPTRVAQDLESVRTAVQMFRIDVRRFPHTPEQLVYNPVDWSDSTDYGGIDAIPDPLINRWDGPYLEIGALGVDAAGVDTLNIALDGAAAVTFEAVTLGNASWLALRVANYTQALTAGVSEVIDGNDDVAGGRVQWVDPHLLYHIVPIN